MGWVILTIAACRLIAAGWVKFQAFQEDAREEQQRESCRRRLQRDPENAAACEEIGDSFRRSGRLQEAESAYRAAVELMRSANNVAVQHKLQKVQREAAERQISLSPRERLQRVLFPGRTQAVHLCAYCGAPNPPQRDYCDNCRQMLHKDTLGEALRALWTDRRERYALFDSLAVLTVLMILIRLFSGAPLFFQGLFLASTMIVLGWKFLKSIEGHKG